MPCRRVITPSDYTTPQAIYDATKEALAHGKVDLDYIHAATLVTLYTHQQANRWGLMIRFWVPKSGGGTRIVAHGPAR